MASDRREPALWVYVAYLAVLLVAYDRGFGEPLVFATVIALLIAEVARAWRRRR